MNKELDELEKKVMEMLLRDDDPVLEVLYHQYQVCTVHKREFTGAGFFTDFSIPKVVQRVGKKSFAFGDVIADIESLKHGAGFVLFIEDGLLSMLEGYTYDEPWPREIKNFQLSYINGKRDLYSLRKIWQK